MSPTNETLLTYIRDAVVEYNDYMVSFGSYLYKKNKPEKYYFLKIDKKYGNVSVSIEDPNTKMESAVQRELFFLTAYDTIRNSTEAEKVMIKLNKQRDSVSSIVS